MKARLKIVLFDLGTIRTVNNCRELIKKPVAKLPKFCRTSAPDDGPKQKSNNKEPVDRRLKNRNTSLN